MARETYHVPLGPARAEISVLNSRFIASLDYVETVEEARNFIASIRNEFPNATHNVPAFIVGGGNSRTEFCSDDGEPSGTSGRPLLAVLHGSGLGNVAVVVTRYFGGTLLGTGGLVKAYSEAGKKVLEATRRGKIVEVALFSAALPYRLFEPFKSVVETIGGRMLESEFAELVRLKVEIPLIELENFRSRCADLSGGGLELLQYGQGKALVPIG
jgi:uncharacterized YigZ family protein